MPAANEQFKAAHEKEPAACPPRGNFATDLGGAQRIGELKAGNFFKARTILEPAVQAANDDTPCFATSPSTNPDIRAFVRETPERLSNKMAALKARRTHRNPRRLRLHPHPWRRHRLQGGQRRGAMPRRE